jgi:lysophospholipase L1-like esterase
LRTNNINCNAPEIVTKTGWTSFELMEHMASYTLKPTYDFVTLLIGVNNQYRHLNQSGFKKDYHGLIQKALAFVNQKPNKVIAIAIPDWGYTPFATTHIAENIQAIHTEISNYNKVCKTICTGSGVHLVDITAYTNTHMQEQLLTHDALHYSAKMYQQWVNAIAPIILSQS